MLRAIPLYSGINGLVEGIQGELDSCNEKLSRKRDQINSMESEAKDAQRCADQGTKSLRDLDSKKVRLDQEFAAGEQMQKFLAKLVTDVGEEVSAIQTMASVYKFSEKSSLPILLDAALLNDVAKEGEQLIRELRSSTAKLLTLIS